MFSFEAKAKHKAWTEAKGNTQEQARAKYIAYTQQMIAKYGLK